MFTKTLFAVDRFVRRLRDCRGERVSSAWLSEQERAEDRIGVDGVAIDWPIKKILNESSVWNAHQYRKRA